MIQDNIDSNKIKENKYKILRMSLLLGNGEDREDTINNFEDASREIDAMNDEIYLKDLEGKFYDTLTLEEEEKKLAVLVDYIGGRVEQRISLLNDFNNVTGYELLNLPTIKYYDKLDEYKERLSYIREYLSNTKNINQLNQEISDLENKLNDSYVSKAKSEEKNVKDEKELLAKFESIIKKIDEFKDINIENAPLKLNDITLEVQDSKKSLEIFNKSFKTLNQAGINGEEEKEYLSYVNGAKEAYYNNKEQEYLLRLYIILNSTESEYNKILVKRDSINDIIYERIELRKELNITGDDILSKIYNLLERQYDDIINQKDNIENIDYLNNEINKRKDMVNELEKDNQKVEILSLLKEFCIIDTYDTENNNKENIKTDNINKSEPPKEEPKESPNNIENIQPITNTDIKEEPVIPNIISKTHKEEPKEHALEQPKEQEKVADNQVISVEDATKINIEAATQKSNNVMKRVGEMLGVKIEKKQPDTPKEEPTKVSPSVPKNESVSNNNTIFEKQDTASQLTPNTTQNSIPDFKTNIFESEFNADPETKELENRQEFNTNQQLNENPLFNNNLANTTIDEVMANNKLSNQNENNDKNDFWFPAEETPMDLNSLPDIPVQNSNNTFFGDNNFANNLDFPNLNTNLNEKEEKHEN